MKLLLHICCGVCGAWVPQELARTFDVTLFFFNPNIHPKQEYETRLNQVRQAAQHAHLPLIEGVYETRPWFEAVHGLEQEPEGGKRCSVCFAYRLEETARYAKTHGFDVFATTLTVGRNKKAEVINPIGGAIARTIGIPFLARDFKKHGGTNETDVCAERLHIIRQTYCGCVFSHKKRTQRQT
jgi:predicted adenine nucleotide alpha hydrolase (AANH) superfamily ATPase